MFDEVTPQPPPLQTPLGCSSCFFINKHKIQWQITRNEALSYLKHAFTPSMQKILLLPLVTAETNKKKSNSNILLNFSKKLQEFILMCVTTTFTYPGKMPLT